MEKSKLWELWRDFWAPYDKIKQGHERSEIRKVKSHCDKVEIVPLEHKHGNDMADKYAGEAAIEVTSGDEARVRRLDRRTLLIQERMIQAIFMLPNIARHPQETSAEKSTNRAPRIAAAKALQHKVIRRGP